MIRLVLLMIIAAAPLRAEIVAARYEAPTARYVHGVLGDALEWGELVMDVADGRRFRLTLPENRVFEDLAPRIVALPDEPPVVVVVETDRTLGARLALYRETGLVAATPFIGQSQRWLAPVGAADLDGDGMVEFAYVDRPHLARTLMVWRYARGQLTHLVSLPGFTNHRIGEDTIAGGIRDCGNGPEIVVADGNWATVQALKWDGRAFQTATLGRHRDRSSFAAAMACRALP